MDGDADIADITPDAAQAEINATRDDAGGAYWDSGHRDHGTSVDRVTALTEIVLAGRSDDYFADEAAPAMQDDADTGMTVTNDFVETVADVMAPPETPEDYSFDDIKVKLGNDEAWDAGLEAEMRPIFHAAGLSDVEANGLVNTLIEVQNSTPEQHDRMTENTRITLQQRWGSEFAANLNTARGAAQRLGGNDFLKYLGETGLGNHWNVVETLYRVGQRMGM
jgi:hypothetical protein